MSRFRGRNASVILLSFYCISLVLIKSVLIKPVLIKSFEMKQPFMVWISLILRRSRVACERVHDTSDPGPSENQARFGSVLYQFVAQKLPRKAKVALGC